MTEWPSCYCTANAPPENQALSRTAGQITRPFPVGQPGPQQTFCIYVSNKAERPEPSLLEGRKPAVQAKSWAEPRLKKLKPSNAGGHHSDLLSGKTSFYHRSDGAFGIFRPWDWFEGDLEGKICDEQPLRIDLPIAPTMTVAEEVHVGDSRSAGEKIREAVVSSPSTL
jgi:hypothetical protein